MGPPVIKKQLWIFLGMAAFCSLSIPEFWVLASRGSNEEPLKWDKEQQQEAFQQLRTKLSLASLWLYQTYKKPFTLFEAGKQDQALGVLTQK